MKCSSPSFLFCLCTNSSHTLRLFMTELIFSHIHASQEITCQSIEGAESVHSFKSGMSKVRPAGQIRPSVIFYPARSLVMKYKTLAYCYLASSINILHLPTRDQQHFTQHNPQRARIHGQWFSTRILT